MFQAANLLESTSTESQCFQTAKLDENIIKKLLFYLQVQNKILTFAPAFEKDDSTGD